MKNPWEDCAVNYGLPQNAMIAKWGKKTLSVQNDSVGQIAQEESLEELPSRFTHLTALKPLDLNLLIP